MATPLSTQPAAAKQPPATPAQPRRKRPALRWITLGLVFLTSLAATLATWVLSASAPLQSLELKTYDLRFVLRGAIPPPREIILVLIDERTEKEVPEPRIFWHRHYATVMRAAAAGGARAIGMDVFFAMSVAPWAPDADREVAAAFSEVSLSVPVVLGYTTLEVAQEGLPLYLLARSQNAMAFANLTVDVDGFVRRQELESGGAEPAESFAARLAALALGVERGVIDPQRKHITFGNRVAPLDRDGLLPIHYWGPGGVFPSVSMAEVLAAARKNDTAQLQRWFQGKVVLVGNFLPPEDMHPTPFYLAPGQRWTDMAGVEVHANTLATLLEQRFLREAPAGTKLALVLVAAAIAAGCIFGIRFPWSALVLLAGAGAYLVVTVVLQQRGWVLPVVPPLLAMAFSGFGSYGLYAVTQGRQRKLLQEVFGRYVSREIAQELLAYGDIPLGGTQQQITVLFSDLRNYTAYCHGRDPRQVVEELNEYFTDMTAEIKTQGGMANKFIGDGIMALFGAPIPHPDDALRAVRCALGMVRSNEKFNRVRAERGMAPLVIGIGLHSGEAVVGTIGAPEKMEYTAIGDTVNIASRIEGANKDFGSRLLVSETTYELVRDQVVAEPAGPAALKGVAEPVVLYKILKLREEGAS